MTTGTGRQFARYLTSTHHDVDWSQLTTLQHDCYMAILSSPDLSWAGVIPYLPSRYAHLAADLTERKVARAWDDLADRGMLVIDQRTGELLVRTFIRHDAVLRKPNVAKAFCRAYGRIRSPEVKAALAAEVLRFHDDGGQGWDGTWKVIAELLPELFEKLFVKPLGEDAA